MFVYRRSPVKYNCYSVAMLRPTVRLFQRSPYMLSNGLRYSFFVYTILHLMKIFTSRFASSSDGQRTANAGINVTTDDKVFKIQLERPEKFNAITWEMYETYIQAMDTASKDRQTSVTVVTGDPFYVVLFH